jgi:hypothetical protein
MNTRGWYIVSAVLVVGLLFQLFLRYQYVHLVGGRVMRIDRLSQASCEMPCAPPPTPEPTPQPTPYDDYQAYEDISEAYDARNQRAIALTKPGAASVVSNAPAGDEWTSRYDPGYQAFLGLPSPPTLEQLAYTAPKHKPSPKPWHFSQSTYQAFYPSDKPPVLICYCNDKGGWYWEVHLDTEKVYEVTGNADLEKKYGLVFTSDNK